MAESPSELRVEIEKLERKHTENPEGRYFVPLANAYRKLGAVEHAESLLRDGLRKYPEYLSAHVVLGRCLADQSATSAAVEEFRYVLSLDSQNLIALRSLGELCLEVGQTDDALHWYRELLAVDPMNEEARNALERLDAGVAHGVPSLGGRSVDTAGESEFQQFDGRHDGLPMDLQDTSADVVTVAPAGASIEADAAADSDDRDFVGGYGDVQLGGIDGDDRADVAPPAETVEPDHEPLVGSDEFADFATGAGSHFGFEEEPVEEEATYRFEQDMELEFEPAVESESEMDYEEGIPAELATETIAELYARQGFYSRSAEVLREVIRRRGGDEALSRRLEEIEALASGSSVIGAPTGDAGSERNAGALATSGGAPEEVGSDEVALPELHQPLDSEVEWSVQHPDSEAAPAGSGFPDLGGEDTVPAEDAFAASFTHGFFSDPEPLGDSGETEAVETGDAPGESAAPQRLAYPGDSGQTESDHAAGEEERDAFAATIGDAREHEVGEREFAAAEQTQGSPAPSDGDRHGQPVTITGYLKELASWRAGSDDYATPLLPPASEQDRQPQSLQRDWPAGQHDAEVQGGGFETDRPAEPDAEDRGEWQDAPGDGSRDADTSGEIPGLMAAEASPAHPGEGGTGSAGEDRFPWEIGEEGGVPGDNVVGAAAAEGVASPTDGGGPSPESHDALDDYLDFGREALGAAAEPLHEDVAETPAPDAAPTIRASVPPVQAEDEDDDLESFQTWLRSLKR